MFFLGAGDLLREIEKTDTPLGREVYQTITVEGKLVRPEIISEVFREKLLAVPKNQAVVMESYPRSRGQYQGMKRFWPDLGRGDYKVIFIELSEDEAVKRISKRLICEICGTIYTAGSQPLACTKCGGPIIQRADDRPDAVKKRLEWFNSEVLPLVAEFEKEGKLLRIDGAPTVEVVHNQIVQKLGLK